MMLIGLHKKQRAFVAKIGNSVELYEVWKYLLPVLLSTMTILSGCGHRSIELEDTPWKQIAVSYCVGSPPTVKMHSWKTNDSKLLNDLRGHLHIDSSKRLPHVGTMKTNRVEITCDKGGKVVLYILSEHRLTVHDPGNTKRSFSLTVGRQFVGVLKETIQKATGDEVRFFHDQKVTISKD